jgi:hypothetical protein
MESNTDFANSSIKSKIVFIVLLLFSIHFWDLKYIPQKLNAENLVVYLFCAYSFIMVLHKDKLRFKYAILLLVIGLVLNSVAAFINLGQNPKLTILSFSFYYFILLYFVLHYFKFNRKFLETVIIVFGIIYSIIFTIQYKIYPVVIFNSNARSAADSRQYEVLGHGFLMLAYFLVLNRFLINRKLINIFMALGFMMVLMKSDFRTLIVGAILISAFMVYKLVRFNPRDFFIIVFIVLAFIGLMQYRGVSYIIEKMVSQTESNIDEGDKYVRLIQLEFFYKRYPQNFSYYIIGGGKPAGKENLKNYDPFAMGQDYHGNYNIVWVDIGLLGLYIVVGGIAVFGLLWYTLKAIFIKLPRDKLYLNLYFLYLLIVSFTNEEIYRDGIFAVHAIGLYLIDISVNDN